MAMTVRIKFIPESVYEVRTVTLEGITRIHYDYPRDCMKGTRILLVGLCEDGFEGWWTYDMADIAEFEAH